MSFNLDPNKEAQEIIFSRKTKKINHLPLTFSKNTVSQTSQKHLGVILDSSFIFDENKLNKISIKFLKFRITNHRIICLE